MPGRTPVLAPGSVRMLAAARAAAMRGSPVGAAIRSAGTDASGRTAGTAQETGAGAGLSERRVWFQLAACFDVAEATGCPLADVLTRFAAQLEAEDDADAARQTALAGPRATVRLLTWLPFLGLGLGLLLGVDPVEVLLETPGAWRRSSRAWHSRRQAGSGPHGSSGRLRDRGRDGSRRGLCGDGDSGRRSRHCLLRTWHRQTAAQAPDAACSGHRTIDQHAIRPRVTRGTRRPRAP